MFDRWLAICSVIFSLQDTRRCFSKVRPSISFICCCWSVVCFCRSFILFTNSNFSSSMLPVWFLRDITSSSCVDCFCCCSRRFAISSAMEESFCVRSSSSLAILVSKFWICDAESVWSSSWRLIVDISCSSSLTWFFCCVPSSPASSSEILLLSLSSRLVNLVISNVWFFSLVVSLSTSFCKVSTFFLVITRSSDTTRFCSVINSFSVWSARSLASFSLLYIE